MMFFLEIIVGNEMGIFDYDVGFCLFGEFEMDIFDYDVGFCLNW